MNAVFIACLSRVAQRRFNHRVAAFNRRRENEETEWNAWNKGEANKPALRHCFVAITVTEVWQWADVMFGNKIIETLCTLTRITVFAWDCKSERLKKKTNNKEYVMVQDGRFCGN